MLPLLLHSHHCRQREYPSQQGTCSDAEEEREREGGRERECVGGRKIHVGKRRMGEKRVRVRREELSYEGREERREGKKGVLTVDYVYLQ